MAAPPDPVQSMCVVHTVAYVIMYCLNLWIGIGVFNRCVFSLLSRPSLVIDFLHCEQLEQIPSLVSALLFLCRSTASNIKSIAQTIKFAAKRERLKEQPSVVSAFYD